MASSDAGAGGSPSVEQLAATTPDAAPYSPVDGLHIPEGEKLAQWVVERRLGEGSFGVVYAVRNAAGERYAMKLESARSEVSILKAEYYVLSELKRAKAVHFCEIVDHGMAHHAKYLVMTLIGSSLSDLRKSDPTMKVQKFSLGCALSVGIQCLRAIKELHEVGYLHRDIKPDNFAIGSADPRHIYLIDFGLSRKYRDKNGHMRPKRETAGFRGTLRYASIRSHRHQEQCRADDLESWLYQQVELTKGSVPWKFMEDSEEVVDCKEKCREPSRLREFMGGCPRQFTEILEIITAMSFYEPPNYTKLEALMRDSMRTCRVTDFPYDWENQKQLA